MEKQVRAETTFLKFFTFPPNANQTQLIQLTLALFLIGITPFPNLIFSNLFHFIYLPFKGLFPGNYTEEIPEEFQDPANLIKIDTKKVRPSILDLQVNFPSSHLALFFPNPFQTWKITETMWIYREGNQNE